MTEEEVANVRGEEISENGDDHSKIKAEHNGVARANKEEENGNVGGEVDALGDGEFVVVADSDASDPVVTVDGNGAATEEHKVEVESRVAVMEVVSNNKENDCADACAVSNGSADGTIETVTVDVVVRESESGSADGQNDSGSAAVSGVEKNVADTVGEGGHEFRSVQNDVSDRERSECSAESEIRDDVAHSVVEDEVAVHDHELEGVTAGVSEVQNGVAVENETSGEVDLDGVADVNKSNGELENFAVGVLEVQDSVVAEKEMGGDVDVNKDVITDVEGVADDVNKSDREFEGEVGDQNDALDGAEEMEIPVVVEGVTATKDVVESLDSDVQGRNGSVSDIDHETVQSENGVCADISDEKHIVTNGNHDGESEGVVDAEVQNGLVDRECAEKNEIPVDVDVASATNDMKECAGEDAPNGLEKAPVESVSDMNVDKSVVGGGVQNGSAELEVSQCAEETKVPAEAEQNSELERSVEESAGHDVVPERENLSALNSTDMVGDGNVVSEVNDNAVESEGEPSVDVCEMKNNAVENEAEPSNDAVKSEGESSVDVSEMRNNAVKGEAEPSNDAVKSEGESSVDVSEMRNNAVKGEAEPSNDAVEGEGETSNNALQSVADPSADTPYVKTIAVESEPEPSNNTVEREDEPSNNAVEREDEPSNNAVEREDEPSNNAVEREDEPSNNAVKGEDEPSNNAVEGEGETSNNAVQSVADPSADTPDVKTIAVESEPEPSNNAVERKDEPSNNAVQSEAEPSVDMLDVETNAVKSEVEPPVEGEVTVEGEVSVEGEGGIHGDEDSRPAQEGSTTDTLDGQNMGTEVVRRPFYYLIRLPRYDDGENIKEQIKNALHQVEEKTKIRDAIRVENQTKKASCKQCGQDVRAAISAERAARDLLKSKRQEMDAVQSTLNRLNNAISVGDIDDKIRNMEHMIQHETLPLKEEKQLIRQIKQLKQNREELSTIMGKQDQSHQSLDHKDSIEERSKQLQLLKKELELLRNNVLKSEAATKAARKKYEEENKKQSELQARFQAADNVRQEAYAKLHALKKQLHEKSKYFWEYKNTAKKGQELAAEGKKEELQCFCVDQVERIMELWNKNDEFRRDYVRCNTRSTLRRLQTLDGRSLGPDEEPPVIPNVLTERTSKIDSLVSQSTVEQEKKSTSTETINVKDESVSKAAVQRTERSQTTKPKRPVKPVPSVVARWGDESDEDTREEPVRTKEEEERILKAEMARKEEEAAKLKEMRRLEEIEKAKEALQRKKRNAERAEQRAALKAQKEAEQKEKEREKRQRKKERRKAASPDAAENTEQESAPSSETLTSTTEEYDQSEKPVENLVEGPKRQQRPSHFTRQTKVKSLPMSLRNRGKRRIQPWMWVLIAVLVVVALFYMGNINSLRSSLRGFDF